MPTPSVMVRVRRARVSAIVAVVGLAASLASAATPPRTARCGAIDARYVPSCGAWFGTTGAPDLGTAERLAGRRADIFHEYKRFSSYSGAKAFPGAAAEAAI